MKQPWKFDYVLFFPISLPKVFEDVNEAVRYCDLLQGGGKGCEGVAEIEASSVRFRYQNMILDIVCWFRFKHHFKVVCVCFFLNRFLIFAGKRGLWRFYSAVEEHHPHHRRWSVIWDPVSVLLRTWGTINNLYIILIVPTIIWKKKFV